MQIRSHWKCLERTMQSDTIDQRIPFLQQTALIPMAKSMPDSLWVATAPDAPDTKPLTGNATYDVAIVGAGFNGLRAALCLAEAGKKVCVLDSGEIGWGASGRNGGQVNPIGHEPPATVANRWQGLHDASYAERFAKCVINSAEEVFDVVKRYQIECDAEQNGWIRAVHGPSAFPDFQKMYQGWTEAGADLRLVARDELEAMSGTVGYEHGWVSSRGGSVQPLAYARGLARAAIDAGASIYTQTLVKELTQINGAWCLQTAHGSVTAEQVVLSTNGYTDNLYQGLKKSIVPIISIQAATEPLNDEQYARILPGRQTFADTRRVIYYFKKTADRRLVFGSAGFSGDLPGDTDRTRIRQGLRNVYPFLDGIKIDYIWGGRIAVTQDHLPHIHQPATGLWTGLGCNGRGVAMSTVLGRLLAELALGADHDSIPLPVTDIKSFPFHRFHGIGAKAVLHWREFLDKRESRL